MRLQDETKGASPKRAPFVHYVTLYAPRACLARPPIATEPNEPIRRTLRSAAVLNASRWLVPSRYDANGSALALSSGNEGHRWGPHFNKRGKTKEASGHTSVPERPTPSRGPGYGRAPLVEAPFSSPAGAQRDNAKPSQLVVNSCHEKRAPTEAPGGSRKHALLDRFLRVVG
jgi:hypothetical protein